MRVVTKGAVKRLTGMAILLAVLFAVGWWTMLRMPGRSFSGEPPPLTPEEEVLRDELRRDVTFLAGEIGERNVGNRPEALARSARWLEGELAATGRPVEVQSFPAGGMTCENLILEVPGRSRPGEIVVVGAHYDSVGGSPGANDNGTGVAAALALARRLSREAGDRTLRVVLFANEEPPWFQTEAMGSLVYARRCRERGEDVVAMYALETMGFFSEEEGSQQYPGPLSLFYPSKGNFIGFVGNVGSRALVRSAIEVFRRHATIPSEGAAVPGFIAGVGWSDHWSFWQSGYDALMITDTAPFRYPHYHQPSDTPSRVDYPRLSRVVSGVVRCLRCLTQNCSAHDSR